MKIPPRVRRRVVVLLPFLLLPGLLVGLVLIREHDGGAVQPEQAGQAIGEQNVSSLAEREKPDFPAGHSGPVSFPADGAAWSLMGSDGFTPRTRELAAALDTGSPLMVRGADGVAREFLMRPRRLLGDDFQITLGDDRRTTLAAGLRSYEGRQMEAAPRTLIHAAIAGGAFSAVITEPDGAVTYLRTDEVTGVLRELHRAPEQDRMTCEHDPVTGIASVRSDQPPITEEDWKRAPQAAIEPVVLESNGFDPETGRLDKYVQPIAFGHNYEISLRDLLAIVTLDKVTTGANTTARLTQITSEYLAKAANLAAIYENNLGVRYLLQELILTPDVPAYTEVPNSLGDYGAWISGRRPRGAYHWDLSTKFGNGAFGGSTIGLAWVRSLGTTSPVNVCAKGWNVALEAHEQGHNTGSDHASGGIMNATIINDSRDYFTDVFAGETSAKQIYDHASSRLTGSAVMRHAEEIAWAMDDSVDTPAGQPVEILPLTNDRRAVRNGLNNAVLRVEEVSRVYPIHAGTAELLTSERIRFTPAPGYQGQAWFSYSLRGSVGNGGAGWLHKGDIAVQVGTWDRNNLNLRLAPGQEFSFRPSSTTDTTIVAQPLKARVDTARDDRHLIIIRVLANATGTDSFVIQRDGVNSTVNITYVTDFFQTRPDTFTMQPGQANTRFSPMANDQAAGYRNMADVRPIVGEPTANAQGVSYFPAALRFTGATLTTPAKGAIVLSQRSFTLNSVATQANSGQVTFTPAAGARGVARISYTLQDSAGAQQTNTTLIILPLGEISSPSTSRAIIAPEHGIILEAAAWPSAEPPLTGVIASQWTIESAPPGASVTFDNASATRTGAYFSDTGTYRLRLTLTDGGYATTDEVTVIVEPSGSGPEDGIAAWWKLDEPGGLQATDSSGFNRIGGLTNGIVRSAGIVGSGGVTCDGTDDFIELSGHAPAVQNLAQGTIGLWFKSNATSLRPIFSASDSRDTDRSIRVYLESGILKYKVLGDLGTDTASLASPGTANDDQWHHAAVTVDPSRNAKLYLDGVLVREGVRPFFNAVFNLNSMALGRTVRSDGSDFWRGSIDDVRIYSRPLSGDEVLSLVRLSENHGPAIALAAGPVRSGSHSLTTSILSPAVTDDGRPVAVPATTWSAAPGGVTFGAPSLLASTVSVPAEGTWRLRLEAFDGAIRTWRETSVTFTGNDPGAPWSTGFASVRAPLSSPPVHVNLFDVFGDPDGTNEALTFTVTANTNSALFSSVTTSVAAPRELILTFPPSRAGVADLTVRATDAGGASVESVLRVTVENFAPLITLTNLSVSENSPAGTLVGTLTAIDPEGAALDYQLTGGNVLDAFALDPVTGVLTVATPFALDYESRPQFSLTVRVSEAAQPGSFTDGSVLVILTNANEAPVFNAQNFTVRAGAPGGTAAGTLSAGDPEGNAITFAITGGNTGGAFSIGAGGLLTVANAAALDVLTNPRFTLTLTATDDAVPPAASTAMVRVTLEAAMVSQGAALRWRVPSAAPVDGYAWTQRIFTDTSWQTGSTGIGYDTGTGYDSLLAIDVQAAMFNLQPCIFLRIPFNVPDVSRVGSLTLRMKYEDGYWAWINGTTVAHHGAPDPVTWNSPATSNRDEDAAVTFRDEDLTGLRSSLVTGPNILAIQGLNETVASSDLLILPELIWSPAGTAAVPDPPELTASGAASLTSGSASLTGNLDITGGAPVVVSVRWGRVDGGATPAGWEQSAVLAGARGAGALTHPVSGLRPDTLYFFRFSGANDGGEGWSSSVTFRTPPSSATPDYNSWITGFPGVPSTFNGPNADADADGLTNFLEYGLGGNPSLPSDAAVLRPVVNLIRNGGVPAFDITWHRRLDRSARGLIYQVELSTSLIGNWTTPSGTTLSGPVPTGDGVTEHLTERYLLPGGGLWFIRLRVLRNP